MLGWKSWKYKNLTILLLTFVSSFVLGSFEPFKNLLLDLGLPVAFFAGIFFISTFLAPIAAVTLLVLAEKFSPVELTIVASLGAVVADFTIFNLVKDGLAAEIAPIYERFGKNHFHNVLRTKHFRWLFPVLGGLLILSPLPHDVGINLMGIHKLKNYQFIALSALVNIVGLAFIIFILSIFFKP